MVYLHIPFCKSFCTYCAFYSELLSPGLVRRYERAVMAEMQAREPEIRRTLTTPTLYIGGGTPSVLSPIVLQRLTDALAGITGGRYGEFTVEVNPDDVTPAYAAFLKGLGVSRVSMGIQSFDRHTLSWMARRHDADGAGKAFATLREAGFDNISVDLIFGVGAMSPDGAPEGVSADGAPARLSAEEAAQDRLEADIQALLSLPGGPPEHVSAYQLSVEEGSALFRLARSGRYRELPDEEAERQYHTVCTRLHEAGYEHYEISNYARRDGSAGAASPYRAVHNSAYWTGAPYVGLGPAAHSYDGMCRSWNPADLAAWLSFWENASPTDIREREVLTPQQKAMERVMLSLRTSDGIPEEELRRLCAPARVDACLTKGYLENSLKSANLRIPERYGFISDLIVADLV